MPGQHLPRGNKARPGVQLSNVESMRYTIHANLASISTSVLLLSSNTLSVCVLPCPALFISCHPPVRAFTECTCRTSGDVVLLVCLQFIWSISTHVMVARTSHVRHHPYCVMTIYQCCCMSEMPERDWARSHACTCLLFTSCTHGQDPRHSARFMPNDMQVIHVNQPQLSPWGPHQAAFHHAGGVTTKAVMLYVCNGWDGARKQPLSTCLLVL